MTEVDVKEPSSMWNPLNWFGGGSAALGGQPALKIKQDSPLFTLPPEIRGKIWRHIPVNEHKNLRLVCHILIFDVENDLGVNVKLHGHDPSMASYLVAGVKYLSGFGDQEQEPPEGRTNVQWVERVVARQLDIKGFKHLPELDTKRVLRSPFALTKLSVTMEEEDGPKALEIIDQCINLNTLRLAPTLPSSLIPWWDLSAMEFMLDWNEVQQYNTKTTNTLKDTLRSVESKPLKHLAICMNFQPSIFYTPSAMLETALRKNFYIGIPPEVTEAEETLLPVDLETLDICMPQIRNTKERYDGNQAQLFKSLLDVQTNLTSLRVRIGSVYWRYFETVLRGCYDTLKSLDIDVANWQDPATIPADPAEPLLLLPLLDEDEVETEFINIPEENWFDWTLLFTAQCNLESLNVRMPPRAHRSANQTQNFCWTFANMKKLELHYVKLSQDEFHFILIELPELREVTLKEWYTVQDIPGQLLAYKQLSDHALETIREALEQERLDKITIWGEVVSCNIYARPTDIRGTIQNPNYTIKWCEVKLVWEAEPVRYQCVGTGPTLAIKKNS